MSVIIAELLGGIGVFFSGFYLLNTYLKQLTSRRLRLSIARWTDKPWQGSILGVLFGALTQAPAALSFILAGLVSAGMIPVKRALPVTLWGNVGACLIVILVFLDINIAILFLLFFSGICVAFERPRKMPQIPKALFGLGLLFYGLNMIRSGAIPLSEKEWFQSILLMSQHSLMIGFIAGALLTMLIQSSVAVVILAITFTQAGLLTIDQTIFVILGIHIGSSMINWILGSNLRGTPKQLVMGQAFFNVTGVIVMIILFYLEYYAGIPTIKASVALISNNADQQMTYVCTMLNLLAAVILTNSLAPFVRFLARFWPPTQEEEFSRLQYLHDQVMQNPDTALELIQKEQMRLCRRFPLYIDEIRKSDANLNNLTAHHKAFSSISNEIKSHLSDIMKSDIDPIQSERFLNTQNQQDLIISLEQTLYDISQLIIEWKAPDTIESMKTVLVEPLDFILLTFIDTLEDRSLKEVEILLSLTNDRSKSLQKLRNSFLTSGLSLEYNDRQTFMQVTSLFERAVWLLNRFGLLLKS